MPHFPLSCFPTHAAGYNQTFWWDHGWCRSWDWCVGVPCSCCSLCPTQLLQHGLFHWSSSCWILYLPWTCLSLFCVPCPFLNTFPWRHTNPTWWAQFWGQCDNFVCDQAGVSSTGQSLTRQSNDIFPQAHHHALSVTCFSILSSSGVTFDVLENYLLFSPCITCQVFVRWTQ